MSVLRYKNDVTGLWEELPILSQNGYNPYLEPYLLIDENYTIQLSDSNIEVTLSSVLLTLPTSINNAGKKFDIINTSTGNVKVTALPEQFISNTGNDISIDVASGNSVTLISNGQGWRIK